MSNSDTPIKVLLRHDPKPIAAWLLDMQESTIDDVKELNVDLPTGALRIDTLLQVIFTDGCQTLLHIEIQGRRSEQPMAKRMLNYMSAIVQNDIDISDGSLCSVIIYVGKGAGRNDTGEYVVDCPLVGHTISWKYRVIRLWEIKAETLLEMDKPAFLSLIGQTYMKAPEEIIPNVIQKILEKVQDVEEQKNIFSLLISLIEDKEISKMAGKILEKTNIELLDTPFLRSVLEKGIVEGKEIGRTEGTLSAVKNDLLDLISLRFDVSLRKYRQFESQVEDIRDVHSLKSLFKEAAVAQNFDTLINMLKDVVNPSQVNPALG